MDPFNDAFDSIGADFEELMAGLKPVAVDSVEVEGRTAVQTATDVPAPKRGRRRFPFNLGGGGELPGDQTRFVFAAARLGFDLKYRDRITEADGTAWMVSDGGCQLIAFGQLWTADVVRDRGGNDVA